MGELITWYFVKSGIGWAVVGAMAAATLGCIGSAKGLRISAGQAAGVLSEKPELFGKLFILMALPGTQGFYGFVCAFMMCVWTGLLGKEAAVSPLVGFALMFVGIGCGLVQWRSAIYQGETSAAAINLTARRPDQGGRAILLPALVETYAIMALLTALLLTMFLTPKGGLKFSNPEAKPDSPGPAAAAPANPGEPAAK